MHDDIPPDEAAEFSRAFNLCCMLDEARATAARLRDAADRTTGLERESNIRQAEVAEAEVERVRAELQRPHELSGLVPTQAKPDQGQAAPAEPRGSRQRQQEQDILQALRTLGHDPLRLPRPPAGTPGPKAEVRATLPRMTPKQFDKAWDRLRGFGDIQDVE